MLEGLDQNPSLTLDCHYTTLDRESDWCVCVCVCSYVKVYVSKIIVSMSHIPLLGMSTILVACMVLICVEDGQEKFGQFIDKYHKNDGPKLKLHGNYFYPSIYGKLILRKTPRFLQQKEITWLTFYTCKDPRRPHDRERISYAHAHNNHTPSSYIGHSHIAISTRCMHCSVHSLPHTRSISLYGQKWETWISVALEGGSCCSC